MSRCMIQFYRWISTVGFDTKIQKQALAATVTIATLHSSHLTEGKDWAA